MGYLSGSKGFVTVGGVPYSFNKWKFPMKGGTPKVSNWTTGPYQAVVPGMIDGTITLSGPWNVGSTPLAVNGVYVFALGLDTGVSLGVTAQVNSIEPDNDQEGTPTVSVTAVSTGAFTAAIA